MNSAQEMIKIYLQLCEERRLDEAMRFLDPMAIIFFPGQRVFKSLQEMVQNSATRYRWVKKDQAESNSCVSEHRTIVISRGHLYGEQIDGTSFNGVRYIDLFIIKDNRILEQHVWNDLPDK